MPAALAPHGTYARYQQDRRMNLESCVACTVAANDSHRAYRQRTGTNQRHGCARGLGWPHANPELTRILAREPA